MRDEKHKTTLSVPAIQLPHQKRLPVLFQWVPVRRNIYVCMQ